MWSWWVKVPTEAFTDETLAIDDTQGDYVKSGEWSAGHWGLQGGRCGDQHEVDKVTNMMAEFATNTSYLAAKFLNNESGATWWSNFQLMQEYSKNL